MGIDKEKKPLTDLVETYKVSEDLVRLKKVPSKDARHSDNEEWYALKSKKQPQASIEIIEQLLNGSPDEGTSRMLKKLLKKLKRNV